MTHPPATAGTAADFMAALDSATTRAELEALLPVIRQIRCPFRQRQALLNCWQTKSAALPDNGGANVPASRPSATLQVEPVEGERGRFWVESRTNDGIPYLVDMEEFNGNGWCGCKGFLHYIDDLEAGADPSPKLQCRHIKAVRKWLASPQQNPR